MPWGRSFVGHGLQACSAELSVALDLAVDATNALCGLVRGVLVALTLAISACASTRPPADDTDLRLQAAKHFFGGRYEYLIIHSAGEFADALFLDTR